jgi:hypothetical protein
MLLTLWTVRMALVLYAAVLTGELAGRGGRAWDRLARNLWTAACACFLLHVACAFHYHHGWSHAAAVADTARRTRELLNWEFGAGIYFNHLFAIVWVADVAWWWYDGAGYRRRPRWLTLALHAWMFFIVINGAIVFAAGPTRWVGLAIVAALGLLLTRRLLAKKDPSVLAAFPPPDPTLP